MIAESHEVFLGELNPGDDVKTVAILPSPELQTLKMTPEGLECRARSGSEAHSSIRVDNNTGRKPHLHLVGSHGDGRAEADLLRHRNTRDVAVANRAGTSPPHTGLTLSPAGTSLGRLSSIRVNSNGITVGRCQN